MRSPALALTRAGAGLVAVSLVTLGAGGCDAIGELIDDVNPVCDASSFSVGAGVVGDFGSDSNARHVEAFLEAVVNATAAVDEIDEELLDVCRGIALDLGVPQADLAPLGDEGATVIACEAAAAAIEETLQTSLPVDAGVTIIASPAVCEVDAQVTASCAAECDVAVDADVDVQCQGQLTGYCEGTCSGSCVGQCDAACSGTCSGVCSGSCSAQCVGVCEGQCSAVDASGQCVGTCEGVCQGTCTGTCEGGCQGTCSGACEGSCEGQCRGSCDVAWDAMCDGGVDVDVDVDCQAACEAEAQFAATCSPAEIEVLAFVSEDPDAAARMQALVDTLDAHWPRFLGLATRVETQLAPAAEALHASASGLAQAAIATSARAVTCVTEATVASLEALSRVQANLNVTVTVSVSVTATGTL